MSENVYVYGIGMIKFGKFLEKPIKLLTKECLEALLQDCEDKVTKKTIEAAWFSNSGWGIRDNQHCIRGQVALSANGIDEIPMTNVENACAGGSTAFHGAWTAVKAGLYDCALAIGVEKVYHEDHKEMMRAFITGTDVEQTTKLIEFLRAKAKKDEARRAKKYGESAPRERSEDYSPFMDLYATHAKLHMKKYGTTQRQIAAVAAKNHTNSSLNPLAQYTFPMTIEEVLADKPVVYPLTRAMCAPVGDGAAAAILCSDKFLEQNPNPKAVRVRASVLRSGSWKINTIARRTAAAAFSMAGLGPEDINVAEIHDATAFGEIHQIEQMGFCPEGQGGPLTESGATALDGRIPINPSGGLLSRGHPIGATGLAQIWELVTQLRGEAGERQVKDPKIALAENGGGNIGPGEAAMCIHILEKV
ncbi:MAG TPA: thiolase family protein [Candidatus Lokiarchaeia archaeon]|nr:thiolase family protein [Candidatus Lokiarchaeia archaeon]